MHGMKWAHQCLLVVVVVVAVVDGARRAFLAVREKHWRSVSRHAFVVVVAIFARFSVQQMHAFC